MAYDLISAEEVTIQVLYDFLQSAGFEVRRQSHHVLNIMIRDGGVRDNLIGNLIENSVDVQLIPSQQKIQFVDYWKLNINFNNQKFHQHSMEFMKKAMDINSSYFMKFVAERVNSKDYNFSMVASYVIGYSEVLIPQQLVQDLKLFIGARYAMFVEFLNFLILKKIIKQ